MSLINIVYFLSRPKPDIRICDHDLHVNIKPKSGINKIQLNFYKSFPLTFIVVSLLLDITFHLIFRTSTLY